ncbi:hypothetical protein A4G26_03910 [Mycobacterium kansasii]|uniref:DUF302 domain-containing protein n=2 Tax=Mycobacterium innocens TaxID=2341083 RepID=A0A498QBZ4_9MYCO|nr:hypothetical protein A4G26_03910 [Mycobacterium kansasii]VBA42811.1 hypothetical protein LAUMK13_04213 [Mycobacterium innocens]
MLFASRAAVMRVVAGLSVVILIVAACSSTKNSAPQATNAPATTSAPSQPRTVSTTFISYTSNQKFEATVDALQKAAADNGMMIVGDLNQDAVLAATGLQLPGAHSFFIGNPRIGKTFFDATQAIGAVIPVRMHVWVDGDGPAHISYFDPAPEFTAVDPALGDGGQQISQSIRTIAEAAVGAGAAPQATPQVTKVDTTFITVDTSSSFEATIGALHTAADQNGMIVLGDVNQASRLEAIGLQLQRSHSFFVGNPQIGKTLFGATQAIGAVVPVRMQVWAESRGPAHISYFDPAPLFSVIDPARADVGKQVSQTIRTVADAAAATH